MPENIDQEGRLDLRRAGLVTELTALNDVNYAADPTNGQGLIYNATDGVWGPGDVTVSGDLTGLGLTSSASRLLGRAAASDGTIEEIQLDSTLEFSSGPATIGLTDGGIGASKLASSSVQTAKLDAGAVTDAKLATNAVTTVKINADAVTGAKIADDAIGSEHIADDAVVAAAIADGAVDAARLATNAVTTVKITDANVTAAKLAADAKVSTMLAVGTSTASVANTTIYASWDTSSSDALADSTNNIVVNDSDATQIDISATGRYQIDCSFRMSGNNRIEAFCRTWLDTGSGFVRQSMHTASNYSSRDTDQNTGVVTLSTILSLSSGNKLKFQAEADADGTANMVTNGTLLRIIRHP